MWTAISRTIKFIRGKHLESKNNLETDSNFAKKNIPLIEAKNICKEFSSSRFFFGERKSVRALENISLKIFPGTTYALVGESGSGKSTLANILLDLLPADSGEVFFSEKNVSQFSRQEKKDFRKSVQIIFQNPYESLNPAMRVKDIIEEPLAIHKIGDDKNVRQRIVNEMRTLTGLDSSLMERHSWELSGGQRQRVAICAAMILRPKFLVCDECVSALDVLVQAQILNLLKDFQKSLGITYLFISHNIDAVSYMADTIGVMKDGRIVEEDHAENILQNPKHEYTKKLLAASGTQDSNL